MGAPDFRGARRLLAAQVASSRLSDGTEARLSRTAATAVACFVTGNVATFGTTSTGAAAGAAGGTVKRLARVVQVVLGNVGGWQ